MIARVVLALVLVGLAAVVEHVGVGGIDLDGLCVVGDRAVVVALLVVDVAAVEMGERVAGIERDHVAVVLDRRVLVARALVQHAAMQMRLDTDVLVVPGLVDDPGAGGDPRLTGRRLLLAVASCSAMAWAMARPAGATRSEAAIASGAADQSSLRGQDFIACSFPSVPRVTRDRLRNPASENVI